MQCVIGVSLSMKFIETTVFTKQIKSLTDDSKYRLLQNEIILNPFAGDIIHGSGGIQKIRCSTGRKGKSGGIRVLYYWIKGNDTILMLLAYSKSDTENFTKSQIKILKKLVIEELKNEK